MVAHYQAPAAVAAICERHGLTRNSTKMDLKGPTARAAFGVRMQSCQAELIRLHLPDMGPADAARARRTLAWLDGDAP